MAEAPCSGSEAVLTAEEAAMEMYRFAALMLGNESEALRLVEDTVSAFEIDPCANPAAATGLVRDRVLEGTLEIMHRQDPASFAEVPAAGPGTCLEDDTGLRWTATKLRLCWRVPGAAVCATGSIAFRRRSGRSLYSGRCWGRTMRPPRRRSIDSRGRPCGPRMPWGGCSGKLCARWRPRWCMRHRRRTPEGVSRDRGARAVLLWAHFRLRILLRSASAKVLLRGIRKTRPGAIEYSYLRDSFAFFTW
jgi:hypothetical protein